MANAENCKTILEWAVTHPENHHQYEWVCGPADEDGEVRLGSWEPNVCGTTMCIGGAALVLLSGWSMEDVYQASNVNITSAAAEVLGLTYKQGVELFNIMDNSIALEKLGAYANE